MNDLFTRTLVGLQTSRMTRLIITTARFLEFDYQGHPIGSVSPTQHTHVGQIKVNNKKVMCQKSMKLPAMFEQNPPQTLDQTAAKQIQIKRCQSLTLSPNSRS